MCNGGHELLGDDRSELRVYGADERWSMGSCEVPFRAQGRSLVGWHDMPATPCQDRGSVAGASARLRERACLGGLVQTVEG